MADDIDVTVPGGTREIPAETLHDAVIVDLIDLGVVEDPKYGPKRKLKFITELSTKRTDGKHFNVSSRRFNATMGEKSNLEKFASEVLGTKFTDETRKAFRPIALVGKSIKILTKNNTATNGKTYSNIAAVIAGGTFRGSGLYVRWVPKDAPAATKAVDAKAVVLDTTPF